MIKISCFFSELIKKSWYKIAWSPKSDYAG